MDEAKRERAAQGPDLQIWCGGSMRLKRLKRLDPNVGTPDRVCGGRALRGPRQ